ncbi:MAG: hypothetical protein JST70_16915 [Bacteroidetes bacterium]|nr:hypothetical protein [Bacteroidota bacterium]
MKKIIVDILTLTIAVASFVIPFYEAIFVENQNKWYKRISRIGWFVGAIGLLIIAQFILNISIANDGEKATTAIEAEKNLTISNLQDSINRSNIALREIDKALKDKNLSLGRDKSGNLTIVNYNYTTNFSNNTVICSIRVEISSKPNNSMQVLCNGDSIPIQYRANKDDQSFTIPYMKGKVFAGMLTMGNISLGHIIYDKETGTFDLSKSSLDGGIEGAIIELNVNIPIKQ